MRIKASDYCENVFDGTHDTPKPVKEGFPLVTSKHIKGKTLELSLTYNISKYDFENINKRSKVYQWDILFSMIGSVGEIYLEKNDKINYAIKNLGVFSCRDEYKAKWLYFYLQTSSAKNYIRNYISGAVQKFLPLGILRNFPIMNYEKDKNSIIDLLYKIDTKIELNTRINSDLEAMAKTLYDYWFVQFDFPNKEGKPYKSCGGAMEWNEELKREVPVGWEVENIEDSCIIVDCLHSKKPEFFFEHEKYYLLQLNNILDNGLIDLNEKYYVTKKDYEEWTTRIEIENNDIVITNAGRVAANAQIPDYVKTGIGRNITAIRPKNISPTYLFLSFRGLDLQRQIKWNTDSGAFFTSLNVKGIKKFHITRPPKNIEDKFEQIVYPLRRKREQNQKENQELSSLRDWLLPMLMNGQVSVE